MTPFGAAMAKIVLTRASFSGARAVRVHTMTGGLLCQKRPSLTTDGQNDKGFATTSRSFLPHPIERQLTLDISHL